MVTENNIGWVDDGNGQSHIEPIVSTDMSEELDSLEDQWCEHFAPKTPRELEIIKGCAKLHIVKAQEEAQFEQARVLERLLRVLRKIAAILLRKDNQNLQLQTFGLAFASGLDELNGLTMTKAADECVPPVTKAAVSKATKEWQRFLGFPPSRYMKSSKACESYSQVQKKNHWRRRDADSDTIFKPERKNHERGNGSSE